MTAPIWMAAPPEVHSALLSSGPGPGPLLAAAGAWNALGAEYIDAANDLAALVAAVQAGAWDGPSAESYAAAHVPYITWLVQQAADATTTAVQHETVAGAYTAALAAMPTLGELAANHATHAVLLGTNFFGINTIPIALNEADYVRMWIQAAAIMSTYQGASTAALTASPHSTAAPAIVKGDATIDPFAKLEAFLNQVGNVFNNFGDEGNQSFLSYLFSVPPGTNPLTWLTGKISILSSSTDGYPAIVNQLVSAAGGNPAFIALAYLFAGAAIGYDLTIQLLQFVVTFPLISLAAAPILIAPVALVGLATGGIVGITELALHLPTGVESIPAAPVPVLSTGPTTVSGPPAPAPAPTAPAPASAPTAPAPAPAPPAPAGAGAPPPPSGAGPFPYIVGGTTRMPSPASAQAKAKKKAPEPDLAAPAAAAASARDKARERRRRRAQDQMAGRGYQDMDLDFDAAPPPAATTTSSDRGAGTLGFTGTTRREAAAEAAGLTTLAGDAFGSGPREPMLPSTWTPDEPEGKPDS